MKRIWIVGAILSFMSVATGFSQVPAPSVAPLSDQALAAILDQPTGAACPPPQESLILPDQLQGIQFMTCSATATCNDTSGVPLSCNFGGSGGTCTAQDQNCATCVRGQVYCNGAVTQCPECPVTYPCCKCAETGSCFYCCRCEGGSPSGCLHECEGT
jgi:hypothetical protein